MKILTKTKINDKNINKNKILLNININRKEIEIENEEIENNNDNDNDNDNINEEIENNINDNNNDNDNDEIENNINDNNNDEIENNINDNDEIKNNINDNDNDNDNINEEIENINNDNDNDEIENNINDNNNDNEEIEIKIENINNNEEIEIKIENINDNDNDNDDNEEIENINDNEKLSKKEYKKCDINDGCVNNVLDLNKNICIVDLSYMTFTRFFAIRRWYEIKIKIDKPEWKIPDTYDWMKDIVFMEKFDKLFFEKLIKLCKNKNIPMHNIIFTSDCKHVNNWRVNTNNKYKDTRKDSHVKNKFNNFDIFPYVRNKLIRELQEETRNIILYQHNLEADDLIAIIVEYLKSKQYSKKILIMANDKDYIQLCNSQIDCCDLSGKSLADRILKDFRSGKEYLIYKILFGDVSDNITSCYFSKLFLKEAGINTNKPFVKANNTNIRKIFNNSSCYSLIEDYLEYSRDINKNYTKEQLNDKWFNKLEIFNIITKENLFLYNSKMIDFANIPLDYKTKLLNVLHSLF